MTRPHYSPEAQAQLDELETYLIETAGTAAADAYIDRLLDFCDGIAADPVAGHHRDDLVRGLQTRTFEKRRIICFLSIGKETHIVAIFGTGQQWEERLRENPPEPPASR
jgi:plasmid stabilization system protein ParE